MAYEVTVHVTKSDDASLIPRTNMVGELIDKSCPLTPSHVPALTHRHKDTHICVYF